MNNSEPKNKSYDQIGSFQETPSLEYHPILKHDECSVQDLINYTKGNQKFQKRIFIGFCLAQVMLGMVTVSLIFFFYSVNFSCKDAQDSKFPPSYNLNLF